MPSATIIEQSPDQEMDWTIDWATRGLGTDTINTSSWVASSQDFTLSNPSVGPSPSTDAAESATTIFVTGGIPLNTNYFITNTIVTAGGRTMSETLPYICLPVQNP